MSPLSQRDRRALILLPAVAAVFAAVYFWPAGGPSTVSAQLPVPVLEKRLERMRRLAASAPGRDEIVKRLSAELATREKNLIQADTAPQAQAQLLQVVRRVAQAQQPPLVVRGTEFGAPRALDAAYGEVVVTVTLECGIEQIVNLLTDMGNQPELVAASDLQLNQVANKQKLVPARITFTGLVPRKLVPEKKGGAAF